MMPIIYVHLNFQTEVNLLDDNFTYKEWTNKKLADERKKYNRSNKGIWLELNDDETSAESYPVAITESEIYDGDMAIERNDRSFFFNVDIKAKVNIHKLVKEKIDKGNQPTLDALSINGQQRSVKGEIKVIISDRKL
jgi:hypothetical protein